MDRNNRHPSLSTAHVVSGFLHIRIIFSSLFVLPLLCYVVVIILAFSPLRARLTVYFPSFFPIFYFFSSRGNRHSFDIFSNTKALKEKTTTTRAHRVSLRFATQPDKGNEKSTLLPYYRTVLLLVIASKCGALHHDMTRWKTRRGGSNLALYCFVPDDLTWLVGRELIKRARR